MTDKDWVDLWLSNYHGLTLVSYSHTLAQFLQEEVHLSQVNSVFIRKWLNSLELSSSTKTKHLNCLRSFFSWLVRQENSPVTRSPIGPEFKLPKSQNSLHERILTPEEVQQLLEAITNYRDYLALKLMYVLGLRVSEVCQLTWRDFHPNRNCVKVSIFGKGGKTRNVTVPQVLWKELQRWRGERGLRDVVFFSKTGEKGRAIAPCDLHQAIKIAAKRAGLDNAEFVSCHWLRHSHATHSLDNGAPIHLVKESLGHSSLETTGRYVHVLGVQGSSDYLKF